MRAESKRPRVVIVGAGFGGIAAARAADAPWVEADALVTLGFMSNREGRNDEAIKVLTAKGMLGVRPRTGTRVLPRESWNLMDPELLAWCGPTMDADMLGALLECRWLIEPGAAALAADRASAADVMGAAAPPDRPARSGPAGRCPARPAPE